MPLIAVQNCTITDTIHQGQCQILSGLSVGTKIDSKPVCLDGLKVLVSGGTVPGPQIAPVIVTINASQILNTKIEGKPPLAMGEVSSGSEIGSYQVGIVTQTLPITLTITNAGQSGVNAT